MSFSNDLKYWGDSKLLMGVEDVPFANVLIGPGAPPIKTEAGWLNLFHTVDIDHTRGKNGWEASWQKRYCAGIMLLDLDHSSIIIGMSKEPLNVPGTLAFFLRYRKDFVSVPGTSYLSLSFFFAKLDNKSNEFKTREGENTYENRN